MSNVKHRPRNWRNFEGVGRSRAECSSFDFLFSKVWGGVEGISKELGRGMGNSWPRDRRGRMGLAQGGWVVYSGSGNV